MVAAHGSRLSWTEFDKCEYKCNLKISKIHLFLMHNFAINNLNLNDRKTFTNKFSFCKTIMDFINTLIVAARGLLVWRGLGLYY